MTPEEFLIALNIMAIHYFTTFKSKRTKYGAEKDEFNTSRRLIRAHQLQEVIDTYRPDGTNALYIQTNPRSGKQAAINLMHQTIRALETGKIDETDWISKFRSIVMSPEAKAGKNMTIDVDSEESIPIVLEWLKQSEIEQVIFVKTRGGAHIIVDGSKYDVSPIWKEFRTRQKELNIELSSDMACPVPGSNQGGHLVTAEIMKL